MSFLVAVDELADVALLGRDLPGLAARPTMFLILWKIEIEPPQKSVNIATNLVGSTEDGVVGLHRQCRVVGEVRKDRVDILARPRL